MELFDTIAREVRYSARTLWRSPAFSLINLITLAVGIGATTAIYTVLDAVVLRPLPYRNADRLVSVLHPTTVPGNGDAKWGLSSAGYFYFKTQNHTLEDLGGYQTGTITVTPASGAENVRAGIVTSSIFTTLAARAEVGRLITAADDQPDSTKVVVLSHEYWERAFGGDRAVIGKMLTTSEGDYQIIGVAEPGLTLPKPGPFASTADLAGFGVDVWFPEKLDPNARPINSHQYSGIGRLKRGVTPQQAQADFAQLMTHFPDLFPTAYSTGFIKKYNFRIGIIPLRDEVLGPVVGRAIWILFAAVAVVLFIACANVANLFLVRLEARRRESAIRGALGGSRAQLAAHYLSESLLLTTTAGLAAVVIARISLGALLRVAPSNVPRLAGTGIGWGAAAFAIGLSIAAGVVLGLIPALRDDVDVATLRENARGLTSSTRQRFARDTLVVGQVALALILLAAAGLMLRSYANLRRVTPGFEPSHLLTFSVDLPYVDFRAPGAATAFQQELQRQIAAIPGVVGVSASPELPLQDFGAGCTGVGRESPAFSADEKPPCVDTPTAMPGFFETLGIQVRGRPFTWSDVDPTNKTATVAVVTRKLADRLWPGEDPMGKGISIGDAGRGFYRVVGIYGVISYLVAQRRPEIGIRMALGARVSEVAALVLGQALKLAAIGVGIGLVAALAGTRLLQSLLFGVSPTDAVVLAGASILLLIIAAVASLAPARRAAGIDPVEAMRI